MAQVRLYICDIVDVEELQSGKAWQSKSQYVSDHASCITSEECNFIDGTKVESLGKWLNEVFCALRINIVISRRQKLQCLGSSNCTYLGAISYFLDCVASVEANSLQVPHWLSYVEFWMGTRHDCGIAELQVADSTEQKFSLKHRQLFPRVAPIVVQAKEHELRPPNHYYGAKAYEVKDVAIASAQPQLFIIEPRWKVAYEDGHYLSDLVLLAQSRIIKVDYDLNRIHTIDD